MSRTKAALAFSAAAIVLHGCAHGGVSSPWAPSTPLVAPYQRFQPSDSAGRERPPAAALEGDIALADALAAALEGNPGLRSYAWEVRVREARALQAGLYPNPELEAELEEFGGSGERQGFGGAQTSLRLSQLIDLGGTRAKQRASGAWDARLGGWDYEVQRLEVFAATAEAYVEALAAQRKVALAERSLELSEELAAAVGERVKAGKVSPIEGQRASVLVAQARLSVQQTKQDLERLRASLAVMWGAERPEFGTLSGKLSGAGRVQPLDALAPLLQKNPALSRWQDELQARKAAIAVEESRATPDLAVGIGLQRFEDAGDFAMALSAGIELPIFDRNQGGIMAARAALAKARASRVATEVALSSELFRAHRALLSAAESSRAIDEHVLPAAESAFDAASEGYRLGKVGLMDLLDAQRLLVAARLQQVEGRAAYHIARVRVERLLGQSLVTTERKGGADE